MEPSHENDDLSSIKKADEPSISIPKWTWWPIQRRYLIAFLSFFGLIHVYFLRINMSFAIVAMNRNYSVIEEDGNITYVIIIIQFSLKIQQLIYIFNSIKISTGTPRREDSS